MNLDKTIERFALMEPEVWRKLALKVSWYYRSFGQREMPILILAEFGGNPPDRDAWDMVRVGVSQRRRALRYQAEQYEITSKTLRRRAYMKDYMRGYRAIEKKARRA